MIRSGMTGEGWALLLSTYKPMLSIIFDSITIWHHTKFIVFENCFVQFIVYYRYLPIFHDNMDYTTYEAIPHDTDQKPAAGQTVILMRKKLPIIRKSEVFTFKHTMKCWIFSTENWYNDFFSTYDQSNRLKWYYLYQ